MKQSSLLAAFAPLALRKLNTNKGRSTTNPVGWSALAIGATVYGGIRVGMELYDYYKKP